MSIWPTAFNYHKYTQDYLSYRNHGQKRLTLEYLKSLPVIKFSRHKEPAKLSTSTRKRPHESCNDDESTRTPGEERSDIQGEDEELKALCPLFPAKCFTARARAREIGLHVGEKHPGENFDEKLLRFETKAELESDILAYAATLPAEAGVVLIKPNRSQDESRTALANAKRRIENFRLKEAQQEGLQDGQQERHQRKRRRLEKT